MYAAGSRQARESSARKGSKVMLLFFVGMLVGAVVMLFVMLAATDF